jgi:hypothetical protein
MASSDVEGEKDLISLALQEGHDADIPSNAGVVSQQHTIQHRRPSTTSQPVSLIEKDIEKPGEISPSAPSLADEEKQVGEPPSEESNIVWWDSEDDPQNPMNWSPFHKWGTIAVVSGITLL